MLIACLATRFKAEELPVYYSLDNLHTLILSDYYSPCSSTATTPSDSQPLPPCRSPALVTNTVQALWQLKWGELRCPCIRLSRSLHVSEAVLTVWTCRQTFVLGVIKYQY